MAKKKIDLDLDFDFDLDKELDSIGFNDAKPLPPPKNAREAISRTSKDAFKGFKDEIFGNKFQTFTDISKASLPSSLSDEVGTISNTVSNIKDAFDKNFENLKKETAGIAKSLGKLLPENSKLAKMFKGLESKLSNQYTQKGPSKEEIENQRIQEGILASLGEMMEKSHVDAMVQQALTSKQSATTNVLLRNIYAESHLNRVFQYEITNKYYRKSLELQYRQLFVQKELLELTRFSLSSTAQQLEAIVRNTALPDIIKTRSSEFLKAEMMQRVRGSFIDTFYKSFKPFEAFSKNIEKRLTGYMQDLVSGLSGANFALESASSMREMMKDQGMTSGEILGQNIAGFGKEFIGGRIGRLIEKSGAGKKGIYAIKNAAADPRAFLKSLKDMKGDSRYKKALRMLGGAGYSLSASPNKNIAKYDRVNLDNPHVFDGRAHSSIVKVIPGYLSRIHSELGAIRQGLKIKPIPSTQELVFDNKTDMFTTKSKLMESVSSDLSFGVKIGKYDLDTVSDILQKSGISLSGSDKNILYQALYTYMMNPGSTVHPGTLYDANFLATISDPKIRAKLNKGKGKLIRYLQEDPYETDRLTRSLSSVRASIPSMNKRFEDMYKSGMADVLLDMNVGGMSHHGNMLHNEKGVSSLTQSAISKISFEEKDPVLEILFNKKRKAMLKSNAGLGLAKRINNKIDQVTDDMSHNIYSGYSNVKRVMTGSDGSGNIFERTNKVIKNMDRKSITEYFLNKQSKVKEFFIDQVNSNEPRLKKLFMSVRNKAVEFNKTIIKKYDKAVSPEEREKVQQVMSKFQNVIGQKLKDGMSEGFTDMTFVQIESEIKDLKKVLNIKSKQLGLATVDKVQKTVKKVDDNLPQGLKSNATQLGTDIYNRTSGATNDVVGKTSAFASDLRQASRDPAKMAQMTLMAGTKLKGFISNLKKARPLEELQQEYYKIFSPAQIATGNVPKFDNWIIQQGYKIKQQGLIKTMFQQARKLDRKIAGAMVKAPIKLLAGIAKMPFKMAGSILGIRKKGILGKTAGVAGKAGGAVINAALDMLPFGLGTIMKGPFTILNALATKTAELVEGKPEDKEAERKGGWMSRLKLFNRKKDDDNNSNKSLRQRIGGFMKENKGLTMLGIMGGLYGITRALGVDVNSVLKTVKWLGGAIISTFKFIGGAIGGLVNLIPDFLKPDFLKKKPKLDKDGNPVMDANGNPVMEGGGSSVGAVAAAGIAGAAMLRPGKALRLVGRAGLGLTKLAGKAGLKVIGLGGSMLPGTGLLNGGNAAIDAIKETKKVKYQGGSLFYGAKPKSIGRQMVRAVAEYFNKSWLPGSGVVARTIAGVEKPLGLKLDKVLGSWDNFKSKLGKLRSTATNPKVVKKVGKKTCAKVMTKLATMVAAAATGLGAFLTAGMILWELGWTLYYMWHDDISFWSALGKQLFGIDPTNEAALEDEDTSTPEEKTQESRAEKIDKEIKEKVAPKKERSWGESVYKSIGDSYDKFSNFAQETAKSTIVGTVEGGRKVLTKVREAWKNFTTSPYVDLAQGNKNTPDIKNINPDLRDRVNRFAELYYQKYGKLLPISDGKRDLQKQISLWEAESKTPYSKTIGLSKEARQALIAKNGGKEFNFRGGFVGYPNPNNPHIRGNGVDIHIGKTPFASGATGWKPEYEEMLKASGLYLPYTGKNGTAKERWHVAALGTPMPPKSGDDLTTNTTEPAIKEEIKLAKEEKELDSISALDKAQANNAAMMKLQNDNKNVTMQDLADLGHKGAQKSLAKSVSYSGADSSISFNTGFGSGGSVDDILQKQLMVQMQTYKEIKELKDFFVGKKQDSNNTTEATTTLPNSVIDLSTRQDFSNMMI